MLLESLIQHTEHTDTTQAYIHDSGRHLQAVELGPLGVIAVSAEGPTWPGRSAMGLAKLNEARQCQQLKLQL